ncbi:molecular chaperone [Salmonella enterica subsp. enterica]|uniref:Molecular chaperone n=1 Tax=Salmonella enterica I TaxID=59201 RepID=A0A3S4JG91_SALET|nr:molecular chaperone [Salmonella enterica subsp. enterica]
MSFQSCAVCWDRCFTANRKILLLVPLFTLIREGKLAANWPLEQDDMLARLQKSCDITQISTDYNALFVGEECAVAPYRSAWVEGAEESEVRAFLTSRGMPLGRYACRSHWHFIARGLLAGRSVCRR